MFDVTVRRAAIAVAVMLSLLAATPLLAQTSAYNDGENGVSRHHLMLSQMMKDMTQKMGQMADQMSQGALTADQSQQMARRMEQMSKLMHRMAGFEARPAMREKDAQKEMQGMRKQMDEMTAAPAVTPGAR